MKRKNIQEENQVKKKALESIRTHICHAPHTEALSGILLEFLMSVEEKDRIELLQVIIEDYHYVESDNMYSIPMHYEISLEARLKKLFEENVNFKVKCLIQKSIGLKTEKEFYEMLYQVIFTGGIFETNHQRAYALYLLCANPMLPYVYTDFSNIEDMDDIVFGYSEQTLPVEKQMRLNFILNSPLFNVGKKVSLVMDEFQHTKRKERELVLARIISFYEKELNSHKLFYIDKIIL